MVRLQRLLLLVLSFALVCGYREQAQAAAEKAGITIGLLLPPEEPEAASLRDGVALAVEHANLGAGGKAKVVTRGRVGQWGADAMEAARMVLDDGALGLIAPPNGAATHLTLQVAGRTAVPVISLCSDSSVSRTGVPWMVRIAPTTIEEVKAVFSGLNAGTPGFQRWTAVIPDGRSGREIERDLSQAGSMAHCELNKVYEVNPTLTNLQFIVAQALKEEPDAVFIWLDPIPAAMVTRSLRNAGFAGKLAGPSRCNSPAFLGASSEASDGFLVPGIVIDTAGEARLKSFQTAFRQRFGREADFTAVESYDAATLLVHILRTTDLQSLPRAFPLGFSLPGASGDLSFDVAGNRKLVLRLLSVRKGHFEPIERELKK